MLRGKVVFLVLQVNRKNKVVLNAMNGFREHPRPHGTPPPSSEEHEKKHRRVHGTPKAEGRSNKERGVVCPATTGSAKLHYRYLETGGQNFAATTGSAKYHYP